MDYAALLYGPIYELDGIAVDVTLTTGTAGAVTLRAIDETRGLDLPDMLTTKPVALVRMTELAALGIARADLPGATLAMNGRSWRVEASQPRPGPLGEAGGEVILILREAAP